jgi:hypothetical protein
MGRPKKSEKVIPEKDIEEFPFDQFPWKLVHKDGKDGKEIRKCYFDSEHNRQKHIDRYKFKKNEIKLSYKYEK